MYECCQSTKGFKGGGGACNVLLFKGKGEKKESRNYRGISLLIILEKVFGRVVIIERVVASTDNQVRDKQGGFRRWMGCVG